MDMDSIEQRQKLDGFSTIVLKPLPIVVILILTIVFFYPVLFNGKTFLAFDILFSYFPWRSFAPPDFRPANPLISDPVNIFYLYYQAFKNAVASGELPFWNPSYLCGLPSAPPTSPLVFIGYALLPATKAHDFLLWFHLLWTGVFMYLYLKEIGLQPLPSLFGAVAWMFNGYVMVWFEFEHTVMLAGTLPAALFFVERWYQTRDWKHGLGFSISIAYSISTGYAHLLIYQFLLIGVYILIRGISKASDGVTARFMLRKHLPVLVFTVLITLMSSASFLIGHLFTYNEDSQRSGYPIDELYKRTGRLPVSYLTTVIFPDFYGNPARGYSFTPANKIRQPYNNYNELCLYAGIVPLFLCMVVFCYPRRRRYALFYLTTLITTLTMAMGSPLYLPLARFVPGLDLSTPTRILYLFGFSMAVLTAMGCDILLSLKEKKWRALCIWSVLAGLAVCLFFFVQTEAGRKWAVGAVGYLDWQSVESIFREHFWRFSPVLVQPLALVLVAVVSLAFILFRRDSRTKTLFWSILLLILSVDLLSFGRLYNTAVPRQIAYPETPALRFLKKDRSLFRVAAMGRFLHNSFAPFGIQDAGGYGSFYPKRYGEYLYLSQHGLARPLPNQFSRWVQLGDTNSPLLDLINIKYFLIPKSTQLASPKLELVYDGEIKIYRNKNVFPRAFFVSSYQHIEDSETIFRTLGEAQPEFFKDTVLIESPPPQEFIPRQSNPGKEADATIQVLSYGYNRIEVQVTSREKGFLVIGDNYHPNWRAEVDGQKVDILKANYIMRAVPVSEGSHRVVLRMQPKLLIAGFYMTCLGWVLLLTAMGILCARSMRGIRMTFSRTRT